MEFEGLCSPPNGAISVEVLQPCIQMRPHCNYLKRKGKNRIEVSGNYCIMEYCRGLFNFLHYQIRHIVIF